jgi:hypothetical protein
MAAVQIDASSSDILGQNPSLVGQAAVGEISAERQHIGVLRDPGEQRLQGAG